MMKNLALVIGLSLSITACGQDYKKHGIDTSEKTPQGLAVNDEAPNFKKTDQEENPVELYELTKEKAVVIVFYRGNWCPVCNKFLQRYQDSLEMIEEKGARLIAITPEKQEETSETGEEYKAGFSIISDSDREIMKKYGVDFRVTGGYATMVNTFMFKSIANHNEQEDPYLPVPATYIINKENQIHYRQFDPNYKKRASVKDILDHLPR
ncbi:MAG: peroxiredoxin-like family protein [Bacteroidota bacterium]